MSFPIKPVLSEYGIPWALARGAYAFKLKGLKLFPWLEGIFEKRVSFPKRTDILQISNDELESFLSKLPQERKDELLKRADDACKGKILGFSSVELGYGDPVDWQLNPLTGVGCDKNKKWYAIPDFAPERGDIKVTWEISRFSHFVTLARAFLLTKDEKYYKACIGQLRTWLEDDPYSCGANFKCGQECALRMMNALLAFTVFRSAGLVNEDVEGLLRELVFRCYKKILSNFFYAYRCIKNNHTISELAGMIVGAWCCGDGKRLKKAYRMLDAVLSEQFFEDGGYRQLSFNYQRLALQDLEFLLSISKATGSDIDEAMKERLLKSAGLLYQCMDETGDVPNYGANDGALIFQTTSCGYRDFRPIVNTIYALVKHERVFDHGMHDEELLWFSGGESLMDAPQKHLEAASAEFPYVGLFTLRDKNLWCMAVLNDYRCRPGHMDQLHIDLWIKGVNVLCDSGTYSYAGELGKQLRSVRGHNTACVDGRDQMNSHGEFIIYGWTERERYCWGGKVFSGTMASKNGYRHERQIALNDRGVEVSDNVFCNGDAKWSVLYHTPCRVDVHDSFLSLSYEGKELCRLQTNAQYAVRKGCRSLFYMKREEITEIELLAGNGTADILTEFIVTGDS